MPLERSCRVQTLLHDLAPLWNAHVPRTAQNYRQYYDKPGVLFGSYASTGILVDIAMWRANKTLLNHVSLEGSSFIVPWRGVRRDDSI